MVKFSRGKSLFEIEPAAPKARQNQFISRVDKGLEIAQLIVSMLALNDIGFVPEVNVWATNP